MKCPSCEHVLHITERQNIEIDYCPNCRGVWLDKGELDKIIDFSNQQVSRLSKHEEDDQDMYRHFRKEENKADKYDDHSKDYYNKNKKKRSFLSDLFDFD